MSDYTKATDFAAKDALPSGDPDKIIKGTAIDDEFNALATVSITKADLAGPTFTGTIILPTVDIDGGNIDGTIIGAATPAAVTTSALVATTVDIEAGTIDATVIGATTPAAVTTSALVATTADINAGTIDNTVIGATTAVAVTTSALVATTADINAGTVDAVIGGTTPAAGTFTTLTSNGFSDATASADASLGVLSDGRVVIGDSADSAGAAPSAQLTIKGGAASPVIQFDSAADIVSGMSISNSNTLQKTVIWNTEDGVMQMGTNNDLNLECHENSHVSVGTKYGHDINSFNIVKVDATYVAMAFRNSASGYTATDGFEVGRGGANQAAWCWQYENSEFSIATNNIERAFYASDGDIYFGTSTSIATESYRFHSTGICAAFGTTQASSTTSLINFYNASTFRCAYIERDGSYITVSDETVKENIVPTALGLDALMGVQVREFDFIDGPHVDAGFIAQELREVIPQACADDGDGGLLGRSDKHILPVAIKAIQEQQFIIEGLIARLDALEA